jgi:hypothetical protein
MPSSVARSADSGSPPQPTFDEPHETITQELSSRLAHQPRGRRRGGGYPAGLNNIEVIFIHQLDSRDGRQNYSAAA